MSKIDQIIKSISKMSDDELEHSITTLRIDRVQGAAVKSAKSRAGVPSRVIALAKKLNKDPMEVLMDLMSEVEEDTDGN